MTLIGLWGVADIGPTDAELSRLMSRLRSSSLRTFMQDKVRPFINQRTIERFESEGDDASGKWEQLQLTTGRIRMFQGFPPLHPINVRTGQLRAFVTTSSRVSNVGRYGASATFPGKLPSGELRHKLEIAQMGGRGRNTHSRQGPNRAAPPRPVLALGFVDQQFVGYSLLDWIKVGAMP